jgi:hypothetical protein
MKGMFAIAYFMGCGYAIRHYDIDKKVGNWALRKFDQLNKRATSQMLDEIEKRQSIARLARGNSATG